MLTDKDKSHIISLNHHFSSSLKEKDGPRNKTEIVTVPVNFVTNEIMILPLLWYGGMPCLRLELYGCPGMFTVNLLEIQK